MLFTISELSSSAVSSRRPSPSESQNTLPDMVTLSSSSSSLNNDNHNSSNDATTEYSKKVREKNDEETKKAYYYPNCVTTERIRQWVLEDVETHSTPVYTT
mmetsp:Transcript_9029/g.19519  ORF Transcript_9029/g.19519 Transcript_9029/m.19519 type:complete len:101 (+) Transcript_9029:4350-4652(+)